MGDAFLVDNVALGFRRLSIFDLTEAGKQPMRNDDESVVIMFNGEIYNFQELRRELEAKGYVFHATPIPNRSCTDTKSGDRDRRLFARHVCVRHLG